MNVKLVYILALCLCCYLVPSSAKPTSNLGELKDGDLAEKFVEFLEQDRQFRELMSKFDEHADAGLIRQRRQATNAMDEEDDMLMDNVPKQKEGFMDRAAKFMMELLQRFLRWINTE